MLKKGLFLLTALALSTASAGPLRVIVLINEEGYYWGNNRLSSTSTGAMQVFLKNGFVVIDAAQLSTVKDRAMIVNALDGDVRSAIALATSFDADAIVVGDATADASAGVSVDVGLDFGEAKGEGYSDLKLTAFKVSGNFNAKELQLFAADLIRIAGACFNIDPARASAIREWVLVNDAKEEHIYYTAGTRFANKDFGPLHLALEKRTNGRGHSVSVYMSRKGTPGQAPWTKSCITSG